MYPAVRRTDLPVAGTDRHGPVDIGSEAPVATLAGALRKTSGRKTATLTLQALQVSPHGVCRVFDSIELQWGEAPRHRPRPRHRRRLRSLPSRAAWSMRTVSPPSSRC